MFNLLIEAGNEDGKLRKTKQTEVKAEVYFKLMLLNSNFSYISNDSTALIFLAFFDAVVDTTVSLLFTLGS